MENIEKVRRIYESFGGGDIPAIFEHSAEAAKRF
jgi:hypothetical protein